MAVGLDGTVVGMCEPELSRAEVAGLGFGPLGVEEVLHCYAPLPDGCRLALRLWAPSGSLAGEVRAAVAGERKSGSRFPAVLEYLPYRYSLYKEDTAMW